MSYHSSNQPKALGSGAFNAIFLAKEKKKDKWSKYQIADTSFPTFLFSSKSTLFATKNSIKFGFPEPV